MAQRDRPRAHTREEFDFSDEDVDVMWDEIVTAIRRPKLERATSEWNALGDKYRNLGHRSST